ncbi:MAG: hypothetical protein ACI8UO_004106 [Verrucomicrobiales bacterium]|jgi:hypothetical protein
MRNIAARVQQLLRAYCESECIHSSRNPPFDAESFKPRSKTDCEIDFGGGAGVSGLRTSFDQSFQALARANDWERAPILARPFVSESFSTLKDVLLKVDVDSATDSVSKAAIWAEILRSCEFFTVDDIAIAHRVTPGRIRQILRLNNLPGEVLEFLISLKSPTDRRYFSEHKLRDIISLSPECGLEAFQELRSSWQAKRKK